MKSESKKKIRFIMLCVLNVIISMVGSMQTPFYPREASLKGLNASEFGLVFGIFQILVCIFSLFYGKYMTHIGVSTVNLTGMLLIGSTCCLFGFTHLMYNYHFFAFCLIIRVIEGIGTAAFVTSSCAVISAEFMNNINLASSIFFSCYGLGLIIGPAVGGAIYEVGGFITPFAVIGLLILVTSSVFALTLRFPDDCMDVQRVSIFSLIKYPPIFLSCTTMAVEYFTIGFLDVTLEPHLRPLDLNSLEVGIMFLILGFTFSASSPLWGYVCDRWSHPKIVCIIGSLSSSVMFILIGPAPFFHFEISLYIKALVLLLLGFALGAMAVGTYSSIRLDALRFNILKPTDSNSLISGVWVCSSGIGSFSGASLGGILFDSIGFAWTTVVIAAFHFLVTVIALGYILSDQRKSKKECENLIS